MIHYLTGNDNENKARKLEQLLYSAIRKKEKNYQLNVSYLAKTEAIYRHFQRDKNRDNLSPADQYYKKCPPQNVLYMCVCVCVCVHVCNTYLFLCVCVERDLSKH